MNIHPNIVVIGNPGSRRVDLFQTALARLNLPAAKIVSYQELLTDQISLADQLPNGALLRIESPGKDFAVERLLLQLGAELPEPEGRELYDRLSTRELTTLSFDKGRILPTRQWYLGYSHLLQQIERQLAQIGTYQLMNRPGDIQLMFDKRACHALCQQHDITVPPALEHVHSYEELLAAMLKRRWQRVFIKPAHGSSASGVVGYRFSGNQHQAITTVEMVRAEGSIHLYNSRKIRTYTNQREIAQLIDALARQRLHVEQWWPKASHDGKTFDLRVVVIAGQARHIVARLSESPLTNLHLLNTRGDLEAIQDHVGRERWAAALQMCEQAAQIFPSLYMGIDLLFTTSLRQQALIEVNAFGDLLPGVLDMSQQDTYTVELQAMLSSKTQGKYISHA